MEASICGGCQGSVPEDLASLHWLPARLLSALDVGDGLGKDLSVQRPVTGVQQSVLSLQLHVVGWHEMPCGFTRPVGSPCGNAPEHV